MANILERADQIVNHRSEEKDRQYGPFHESMKRTAALFNFINIRGTQITATDVYWVLVALKLSREGFAHKEDNLLDAVAYLGALNNHLESTKEKK